MPEEKKLKVCHWTMFNTSGMYKVAEMFSRVECSLGLDSWLCDFNDPNGWGEILDADIHVIHTHLPDAVRPQLKKPLKTVWVAHGTPEYTFTSSVINGLHGGYGASNSWDLCQYWMQHADALVTFWPRHQKIWKSLCDKRTIVDCFPCGVEKQFWRPAESKGRYLGSPSLFTAENCDYSKWPLDLFLCWPWVWPEIPLAHLHAIYIPHDQHRYFYPLINRNGCSFKTLTGPYYLSDESLRNAFVSTDYFIGLVRYGDNNKLFMEAAACGAKTITYAGNPYSHFWITEGDQRRMAEELLAILKGEVKPREPLEVPDATETSKNMLKIYERIMGE